MAKLIQLDEAAKMLGMQPEELVEMRSQGEIHGYRDGATWKFKESEIERFAGVQDISLGAVSVPEEEEDVVEMAAPQSGSGVNVDDDLDEIVDVSEIESLSLEDSSEDDLLIEDGLLIEDDDVTEVPKTSEPTGSSTAVGMEQLDADLDDLTGEDSGIDLEVADDSGLKLGESGVDSVNLGEISSGPAGESEINLDELGGSSLRLSPSSDIIESGKSVESEDDEELDIVLGSDLNLSDDEMELSVGSSEELSLDGSDADLVTESGLGLSDPADSDVTLDPSSSGINLSPSDSGLSLERTPPEIAVTGEDQLELGEAEELIEFGEGDIELDDVEGLETDDFVLTPVEGDLADDDSGSQVIALDTDELGEEGDLLGDSGAEDMDAGLGTVEESPGIPGPIVTAGSESPYSIWDVVGFGMIMLPLTLAGVMVLDLAFHIWSFDEPFSLSSPLMDSILGMFGG